MKIGEFGITVKLTMEMEVLSTLIYIALIVYFSKKSIQNEDGLTQKIYFNGLKLKILASIFLPLVYIFYYEGGDTITYFHDAMILQKVFWNDPSLYFDFLFNGMYEDGMLKAWKAYFKVRQLGLDYFVFAADERAMFIVRIASFLAIITGGSFFASGLIVAFFCLVFVN